MVPLTCFINNIVFAIVDGVWTNVLLILILIILLICSSFFSACETAYSVVNVIRLRNYVDEKKKGAKKALYIVEKFDAVLVSLLVGNNLVNIGSTTIAAFLIGKWITNPTWSNILTTLIMTIIILIFGEITPKSYAKENAEKAALRYSGILFIVIKALWPFTWIFYKIRLAFMRRSKTDNTPQVTEEELESIIETMEDEGVIENEDAELMQNALDINETSVYEIMTPRVDTVAISIDDSVEKIKSIFFEHQYSRIPVYDKDKDNMIGVLRERDFFTSYIKNSGNVNIKKITSPPFFVSKATKVDDLIRDMQKMKQHFAIVVDEHGGTSGIVTMEDALEELVGEIYDEYDDAEDDYQYHLISDNIYKVNPEADVEVLFEELKLGKAPGSNYRNIGGFVYGLCEEIPYKGKVVTYDCFYEEDNLEKPIYKKYRLSFTIDKVNKRRIQSLILQVDELELKNEN